MKKLPNDAVLVPQADSFGAIAVIRSLGQRGYTVHASSSVIGALGCLSNFAHMGHISPSYENPTYCIWLKELIERYDIKVIIPSEGFLLAIEAHFSELSHLIPTNKEADVVYGCLSKSHVFGAIIESSREDMKQNIPNTLIVKDYDDVNFSQLNDWQWPLYIKGDGHDGKSNSASLVKRVTDINQAKETLRAAQEEFRVVLIQDHVIGVKATVNLLFQDDNLLAESMALAIHENPHHGGLTSLRKSWWQQQMYEDAVKRLRFLNWNGPAMVEYKWDASTERFTFIELNSRYWAALNLDILAGLQFPAIHVDYFLYKQKPDETLRLTKQIVVRNALPADFGYLISKIKDNNVSLPAKLKSILGFLFLPFNPSIKADLYYPGDRKLYFLNFRNFSKDLAQAILSRLKPNR